MQPKSMSTSWACCSNIWCSVHECKSMLKWWKRLKGDWKGTERGYGGESIQNKQYYITTHFIMIWFALLLGLLHLNLLVCERLLCVFKIWQCSKKNRKASKTTHQQGKVRNKFRLYSWNGPGRDCVRILWIRKILRSLMLKSGYKYIFKP